MHGISKCLPRLNPEGLSLQSLTGTLVRLTPGGCVCGQWGMEEQR